MAQTAAKKNWPFIIGVLLLSIGMQFANYGGTVPIAGEAAKMNAMAYYVLIAAMGTLGMMLVLPMVGKLTAIFGQRNMIILGILLQTLGRVFMMFCTTWPPYMLSNLLQSIGGGLYTTAAYVLMTVAVEPKDRVKFFGYIAVANAIGAIFGPLASATLYSMGGVMGSLAYIPNLPFTIIGFLLIAKQCPNAKMPAAAKGFDYLGVVLTVLGLAALIFWLNLAGKMFAWVSAPSLILLVLTVFCLVWMIRRELSIDAPAIPIKMFSNKRLTYAFICSLVFSAYATCSTTYIVMWVRMNYSHLPGGVIFNGTYNMAQQVVILILGMFMGGYIGAKFAKRFRPFGIAAMLVALAGTVLLCCLRFTGTAEAGNLVMAGSIPAGMLLIYLATGIGGFTSVVSASSFPAFWQSNTPPELIPSGQSLYAFGAMFGSTLCNAVAAIVLGSSTDYTRAFLVGVCFCVVGVIAAFSGFRFSKEEVAAAG